MRDCLYAHNSIKPAERPLLLRLIRSRIVGSADAYLQDREINSLEDLLTSIKLAFSPHHNLGQLQAMLSTVTQNAGESVLQYGVRVSLIVNQSVEVIEQQYPPEIAYGMVKVTRETALENFIRGLKPALELKVRFQNPSNLQNAINLAQAADWETGYQENLRRDARHNQNSFHPLNKFTPYNSRSRVNSIREGRKERGSRNNDRDQDRRNVAHYSRDFNNIKRNNSRMTEKTCYVCNNSGYFARECPQNVKIICFKCGKGEHYANQCPNNDPPPSTQFCDRCKIT